MAVLLCVRDLAGSGQTYNHHINYTPQKGDIVVINSEKLGKTIIKRVIGTGGDKVVVDYNNNTVTVNGKVISNDNIREAMYNTNLFDEKYEVEENVFEYDVPEGKLFVMGDNRNNSTDSRRIGFIDPSDVLGKAVLGFIHLTALVRC